MTKPCKHTEGPTGYIARHEWLERMAKRYNQTQCPKCGQWAIWKVRPKVEDMTDEDLEESFTRFDAILEMTDEQVREYLKNAGIDLAAAQKRFDTFLTKAFAERGVHTESKPPEETENG